MLESLGVSLVSVGWHALNFLLLMYLLNRFMYRPILKMLDDRSGRIRDSLAQAENVREQTTRLEQESRSILDEARREGQQLMVNARTNADRIVTEATTRAQQEADHIVQRATAELQREREQTFQELRAQVADLTVTAAGQLIRRSLDDAAHRDLVREFLADADSSARRN